METRREFIRKATLLSGGLGLMPFLEPAIQKALAINPEPGSSWLDAEHIVFLMQENRSFDHTFGSLQGVRGFNDPRAIFLPNGHRVWLQSNKSGQTYAPFHLDIKYTKATWMHSLPHAWSNQVDAFNKGKYDQWLSVKHSDYAEYSSLPLTMGYHTRDDIPFYYALADAFTVCDQHFCSSLTGTTPNRLYFWSGTILNKPSSDAKAHVWNADADYEAWVNWMSFPERLEDEGVSWKIYQNELSVGVGFTEEEDAWLANFGDNPIEYFSQYKVKLSQEYIDHLPASAIALAEEIKKREQQLAGTDGKSGDTDKINKEIEGLRKLLELNARDQGLYTHAKFEELTRREKNLHEKAFTVNRESATYHNLTTLAYQDGTEERKLQVPKGDILFQFREDVNNNRLPTVSWLVAPENFSDHPSAAWYGAWYISEVMDILTRNPEVWKKTIFILTYDENDGYFDHVPPFTAPFAPGSGVASKGIDTSLEYVRKDQQSSDPEDMREHCIGLGFRVPLVIASPWTRGGWVCSEIFDHTSSLMFLEKFLSHKTGKEIKESNISEWRRTVCGDLQSAFRPWDGEPVDLPTFIERDKFLESIYNAKFKGLPNNFKALSPEELLVINRDPHSSPYFPAQEKGIRSSCALPYELYVEGSVDHDRKNFIVQFKAGNEIFGSAASGSPFNVYTPGLYKQEKMNFRAYAVSPGDSLSDFWELGSFDKHQYHVAIYGPNGFFREFHGDEKDPALDINCLYEKKVSDPSMLSGNVQLALVNHSGHAISVKVYDHAYKAKPIEIKILAVSGKEKQFITLNLENSFGWYDFSVRVKGYLSFEKRYAGRVETGKGSKTDPAMG
jgi:phospholipase C